MSTSDIARPPPEYDPIVRTQGLAFLPLCLLAPAAAEAFCGFYVANATDELHNPATTVVLMRDGTRTVLSMRNHYEGAPRDFAMVVPVPVVLSRDDVRTLPDAIFDRVDQLAAPRLVEYWEQDPCASGIGEGYGAGGIGLGNIGTIGHGTGRGDLGVRIEAQFAVGEYDVVVLSASDSAGLETWLHQARYNVPAGAAAVLEPYVRAGSKFFVARVDARRVHFFNGRARLSPLRFHYDSESFGLPIRLGLINSPGIQDLVVHILARNERYEVANRDNVPVPTNLDVDPAVRASFGSFYASMFDRVLEQHRGAVVTEYAWRSQSCDPCPVPPLTTSELMTLGADVVPAVTSALSHTTARTVPTVTPGVPTIAGGLAPEAVRRVALRNQWQLTPCAGSEIGGAISPGGQVTLRLLIAPSGSVTASSVVTAPPGTTAVARCMAQAARRWQFPAQAGDTATVFYPFDVGVSSLLPAPEAAAVQRILRDFVLTRLHTRYGRDGVGDDLVFRTAPAITGGREVYDRQGRLEHGAVTLPGGSNNFQGRYVIRHPWTGPIQCASPVRGVWGGRPAALDRGPADTAPAGTFTATDTAFAPQRNAPLASMILQPVPELGLTPSPHTPSPVTGSQAQVPPQGATAQPPATAPAVPAARSRGRMRCAADPGAGRGGAGPYALTLALAGALVGLRRWRRG